MKRLWFVLPFFFLFPHIAFSADSQAPKTAAFLSVTEVLECDLLKLSDGSTVRLIGVDCPNSKDQVVNQKTAERVGIDPAKYSGYAQETKAFVNKLVAGQKIRLEYDEANNATQNKDEQGNVWVYLVIRQRPDGPYIYDEKEIPLDDFFGNGPGILVAVGAGPEVQEKFGYLLNGMIIRSGHGVVARKQNFKHKTAFLEEIEQEAKKAKRGVWG